MNKHNKNNIFNCSVLFIDFDDTYYLHDHHWNDDAEDRKFNNAVISGKYQYDPNLINHSLVKKLQIMKRNGIKIFILTHVPISGVLSKKIAFAEINTPDLFNNYIGVSSSAEKLTYMQNYCSKNNITDLRSVGLIDDMMLSLGTIEAAGFSAASPQYFCQMFKY